MDNISEWPFVAQSVLAVFFMLFLIFISYEVYLKQKFENHQALKHLYKSRTHTMALKNLQLAKGAFYKNQYEQMRRDLQKMIKDWPSESAMPRMIDKISKSALSHRLKLKLLAPKSEILHDFHVEQPIRLIVVGNYHRLASFLQQILHINRQISLLDFDITTLSDPLVSEPFESAETLQPSAGAVLEMKMIIQMYHLRGWHEL